MRHLVSEHDAGRKNRQNHDGEASDLTWLHHSVFQEQVVHSFKHSLHSKRHMFELQVAHHIQQA